MSFEDILVALTAYPEPAPVSAIDDSVALAVALGARISAISCEVRIQAPGSPLGTALLNVPAMVAAEVKKSAANVQKLLVAFQSAAEKNDVFQERIPEKCLTSQVPDLLVDYARLRDLTIMPIPEADYVDRWYAESVIFGSGRPIIVLPERRTSKGPIALDRVVVAWDFSRQSSRAVADALPILKKAKHVFVVTVSNEKVIDTKQSGIELAKYLARHGVDVVLDVVDAAGRAIGEVLEAHVAQRNGDLLVMGAYGHSRFREFVLGGATRSMLDRPPVPVFLSH
jgi:nucleotide-binding universal stress UspA family protein